MIEESGIRGGDAPDAREENAWLSVGAFLLNFGEDGLGYTETGFPQASD